MVYKAKFALRQILLAALIALLATLPAAAQNNERISISAENVSHDADRGATHLLDNVHISRGEMQIRADEGYGYRGSEGWQRIELFGSPVRWQTLTEAGGETTGYADQVVYDLSERTVTLIGNAYIEEARGTFSGQRLVYNVDTEATEGQGGIRMEIEPETAEGHAPVAPEPD